MQDVTFWYVWCLIWRSASIIFLIARFDREDIMNLLFICEMCIICLGVWYFFACMSVHSAENLPDYSYTYFGIARQLNKWSIQCINFLLSMRMVRENIIFAVVNKEINIYSFFWRRFNRNGNSAPDHLSFRIRIHCVMLFFY